MCLTCFLTTFYLQGIYNLAANPFPFTCFQEILVVTHIRPFKNDRLMFWSNCCISLRHSIKLTIQPSTWWGSIFFRGLPVMEYSMMMMISSLLILMLSYLVSGLLVYLTSLQPISDWLGTQRFPVNVETGRSSKAQAGMHKPAPS